MHTRAVECTTRSTRELVIFSLPSPGALVTDPLPFLRSISHSCTVPSEAVTLKRKLPFTFFTKLGPSWLREGGGRGGWGGKGRREETDEVRRWEKELRGGEKREGREREKIWNWEEDFELRTDRKTELSTCPAYLLHSLSNQVKHRLTLRCPWHGAIPGPSIHVDKRKREREMKGCSYLL